MEPMTRSAGAYGVSVVDVRGRMTFLANFRHRPSEKGWILASMGFVASGAKKPALLQGDSAVPSQTYGFRRTDVYRMVVCKIKSQKTTLRHRALEVWEFLSEGTPSGMAPQAGEVAV